MNCQTCHIDPCACRYIASLMPGGELAYLADTAMTMVKLPLPHRAGEGSCPCPLCWAERSRGWDAWAAAGGVT